MPTRSNSKASSLKSTHSKHKNSAMNSRTHSWTSLMSTISSESSLTKRPNVLQRVYRRVKPSMHFCENIVLDKFPASLMSLKTFHSIHMLPFAGCFLLEPRPVVTTVKARIAQWWKRRLRLTFYRIIVLLFAFLEMYRIASPIFTGKISEEKEQENDANKTDEGYQKLVQLVDPNGTNWQFHRLKFANYDLIIARIAFATDRSEELAPLKPILRLILQCMVYFFLADNFVTLAYNFLFGGALLHRLVHIEAFIEVDQTKAFGRRLIWSNYLLVLLARVVSVWIYDRETAMMLLEPQTRWNFLLSLSKLLFETLFFVLHYITLTMHSLWFVYCMVIFRRCIEELHRETLAADADLDEWTLRRTADKLARLHEHFHYIVGYFSLPITFSFISDAIHLIASVCFMIINQSRTVDPATSSFIVCIGLLSFCRLVLVCSVGDQPSNACRELNRLIYQCKVEWTVQEWFVYRDIKSFREQFRVCMFRLVFVQQSSILAMLGFVLNYIVILLQTENYTSAAANGNNTTALDNSTGAVS